MYGMDILTTCSPRHFNLVKSLGAKHVVDYNDANAMSQIRAIATDLRHVFDTIGNANTSKMASEFINSSGGTLCTVRPGKAFTETVSKQTKVTDVLVWTAFLKDHAYKSFFWPVRYTSNFIS